MAELGGDLIGDPQVTQVSAKYIADHVSQQRLLIDQHNIHSTSSDIQRICRRDIRRLLAHRISNASNGNERISKVEAQLMSYIRRDVKSPALHWQWDYYQQLKLAMLRNHSKPSPTKLSLS